MKKIRFALSFSLAAALFAQSADAAGTGILLTLMRPPVPEPKEIVVLYTNDVHCEIDSSIGYAGLAALKNELTDEGKLVTLVDVGDAIEGGVIGTLSKGGYLIDLMNAAGYDLAVPGNHEFNYGMERFLDLTDEAVFPYVCCNLTALAAGETLFDPYRIIEYENGVSIAYVGIDTPETLTAANPSSFKDENGTFIYGFCESDGGEALYRAVQNAVDSAIEDGADHVVVLAHLGTAEGSAPWRSYDVIAHTTGIDVMLDAHSHSTIEGEYVENRNGDPVLLSSTGTGLNAVGQLTLDKDGTFTSALIAEHSEKDETLASLVSEIQAENEALLKTIVAKTDVTLCTNDPETGKRIVRSAETNLGDLCADALRSFTGADIALVNGGGVRAEIPAGDITYEQIIAVHPFGNMICTAEVTGQAILDALEMGASALPGELGGFQQVSGLTYEIDTSIPSSVMTLETGEFDGVYGDYRVRNVMVGGEPLDPERLYTLASTNFLIKSGGDGFSMFAGSRLVMDEVKIDNEVLIEYIVDRLGGVVGDEYADPYGQGRIVIH